MFRAASLLLALTLVIAGPVLVTGRSGRALAQRPADSLRGRVVSAENARALARARVSVLADGKPLVVTIDSSEEADGPRRRPRRAITDTTFDFGAAGQTTDAEVVISNAGAAISGHVTDAAAVPVTTYSVVVFPTDRTKWFPASRFLKLGRPAQDGSFEVTGLPPGDYWVAATDPIEGDDVSGEWLETRTLDELSFRATRITLTERQRVMTVLRLIRR